jgi:hypothetical protein
MACERCSDCLESTHHWLENGDFGNDEADAEGPTGNSHICKHCDAVGDECDECEGSGEIEDENAVGQTCQKCDGEGVVLAKRRTFAEFENEQL